MALGINTNVASLVTQRNLSRSGSSLETSIQRLSSGLRVNSARDDAAGLAIAERMSAQIRGFEVAKRNANDGISALQVADGVLASFGENLQRMRELAVQASTGTISVDDRANLELEFGQLSNEVKRLADTAEFNGVSLINGTTLSLDIQIGADGNPSDNQLKINLTDIESFVDSFQQFSPSATALGTPESNLKDLTLTDVSASGAGGTVTAPVAVSNATFIATTAGTEELAKATEAAGTTVGSAQDYDLDGNGVLDTRVYTDDNAGAGNAVAYATLSSDGSKVIGDPKKLINDTGAPVAIASVTLGNLGANSETAGDVGSTATFTLGNVSLRFEANADAVPANPNVFSKVSLNRAIAGTDGEKAQESIASLDLMLDTVNNQRAVLGAGINRLEAVISNLENQVVNLGAARGRIIDADFARETANLTRTQILQQAGTAMLAQANQLPANVLTLLG